MSLTGRSTVDGADSWVRSACVLRDAQRRERRGHSDSMRNPTRLSRVCMRPLLRGPRFARLMTRIEDPRTHNPAQRTAATEDSVHACAHIRAHLYQGAAAGYSSEYRTSPESETQISVTWPRSISNADFHCL